MEKEKHKEGVTRLKGNTAFHNSNSRLNDMVPWCGAKPNLLLWTLQANTGLNYTLGGGIITVPVCSEGISPTQCVRNSSDLCRKANRKQKFGGTGSLCNCYYSSSFPQLNLQNTTCTNLYEYLPFIFSDEHFSKYTLSKLDFQVKLLNKIWRKHIIFSGESSAGSQA